MSLIVLGGLFFLLVVPAVVLAIVLSVTLRRKRPIEPDDSTPLDRARNAAAALTPEEREALRRTLEPPRRRDARGDEGFTP